MLNVSGDQPKHSLSSKNRKRRLSSVCKHWLCDVAAVTALIRPSGVGRSVTRTQPYAYVISRRRHCRSFLSSQPALLQPQTTTGGYLLRDLLRFGSARTLPATWISERDQPVICCSGAYSQNHNINSRWNAEPDENQYVNIPAHNSLAQFSLKSCSSAKFISRRNRSLWMFAFCRQKLMANAYY